MNKLFTSAVCCGLFTVVAFGLTGCGCEKCKDNVAKEVPATEVPTQAADATQIPATETTAAATDATQSPEQAPVATADAAVPAQSTAA
jgi:hypothetical protein